MDRYTYACKVLENAHSCIERMKTYSKQLAEAREVRQHVTSTYGTERVSSSPSNVNPAQLAIEKYDELIEDISQKITSCIKIIDDAKRFISLASDITSRDLLDMHYMWGWSLGKIAANTNCSIKTISRKRDMALAQLKDALNKKEAEA